MANILVVDDNKNFRKTLEIVLRDAGHCVDEVADPSEALRFLEHATYEVVLTDFSSADSGSADLIWALTRKPARVIILTDTLTEEVRGWANYWGAYSYLEKPYNPAYLLHLVSEAAQESQRLCWHRDAACSHVA